MTWQPSPPRYVRRWAVQGVTPQGDRATTIFDLREHRAHIAVYPATVDTFALLVDRTAIGLLQTTLESGNACTVPGIHAVHGHRLLGLRPRDPDWTNRPADAIPHQGPMELYVHLPTEEIHIVYAGDQLLALHDTLTEILGLMR